MCWAGKIGDQGWVGLLLWLMGSVDLALIRIRVRLEGGVGPDAAGMDAQDRRGICL